jgi:hypothetical protein
MASIKREWAMALSRMSQCNSVCLERTGFLFFFFVIMSSGQFYLAGAPANSTGRCAVPLNAASRLAAAPTWQPVSFQTEHA